MRTIPTRLCAALIPLLTMGAVATVPLPALAQNVQRSMARIDNFQIELSDQLAPGSEMEFIVEGTPRGQASVRMDGVARVIPLTEVNPGIYQGSYTLSRRDRVGPQSAARVSLRVRNFTAAATQTLVAAVPALANRPGAQPAPGQPAQGQAALSIERFAVAPVQRIEPGAELRFTAVGTPGVRATFSIDGVVRDVPMSEVAPGRYEGAYTIRRNDNFPPSLSIVATLDRGGQAVRAQLNQSLLADAKPPVVRNLAPANNEVTANNPVTVSATFDDSGGVGVDARTVRIAIDGQEVTRNASITPQFFTWRGDLRPGTHRVDVNAADMAGNAVRQSWAFTVASGQGALPAAGANLPLQITSHANNAQVASGPVEVRGRTLPDAKVEVEVHAIASLAGAFGINQRVLTHTMRSDANGDFAFTFQSQSPVPGTRYETTVTATRGDAVRETKLVLFQQR
ncbi:MAG TPA: Ig-like domain-containing protein [Rubrivivax sp.]|nr:Ig-like domain-containing protein [Rubrivivax sp.]